MLLYNLYKESQCRKSNFSALLVKLLKGGLFMSSSVLKIIACFFMLIDHVGCCLFPQVLILRMIGRISMPLFAFQISIGYKHTKNKMIYMLRMLIFAIVSQVPFLFFMHMSDMNLTTLNIGFTFSLAIASMLTIDFYKEKKNLLILIFPILIVILGNYINVDYGSYGILIAIIFYLFDFRKSFPIPAALFLVLNSIYIITSKLVLQFFALLSLPILFFFNNKKGIDLKYLFYVFYPLHLVVLGLVKVVLIS